MGGERGDHDPVVVRGLVGFSDDPAEVGLGQEVVGPVHPEDGVADLVPLRIAEGVDLLEQLLAVLGHASAVAVAVGEVLGPDPGAVGGLPPEAGGVDGRRHAPPHDGVVEPEPGQDLGHLGDVPEHVRQVPDRHRAAEAVGGGQPEAKVAHVRLARDEELVGQRVPGAEREPPGLVEGRDPLALVGADLEVVVDHGELAVELEVGERAVALEAGQEVVEQLDELHPEQGIGLVPLAVPVRVRNDVDLAAGGGGHGPTLRRGTTLRPCRSS